MSAPTPTVFNGRYELHRQLARGGMAEVFLAHDQLLDRPVAVKVLFPEYATDPSFVERFRREAQAAANLNHPNIVSIFDWGEENGTYFIVMEYIEGRSLAEILRTEGRLHPDRAADIVIDVAAALGFAHRNGLVHRDIKPGNVMVTPTGQIKVADFGIATAMNAGDMNLTKTGLVMGTANYFSPEQAQGRPVDPRSDLYSLGVVLYELLVGEPPFKGENPVTIAYKHVQEAPVPPRSRSAQIAESLEAITLKLLAKNPAHRYPSAEDLRADLRRYREGAHELARPLTPAVRPPSAVAPLGLIEAAAHTAALQPVRVGAPPRPPQRRSSTARTGTFAVLIVLVLIVLLAILILLFTDNNKSNSGASGTVAVPSLINKTRADAEKAITDAGLKVQVEEQDNAQYEVGKVFRQDPAGGTKVARDSTVRLTVSKGNSSIAVKSVIGSLADDAEQALRSQGFEVKRVPDPKSTRPENEVVAQNPVPGTTLAPGQTVTITFSSPEEKVVKDVANQTAAAAAATLARDGFEVQEKQEASDAVEPGKVIRTDPPANSKLKVGQTITIFTSSGPAQVLVPDVVGLFSPTAQQTLEQSGLIVAAKFQELPAGSPNIGRVIDQTPNGNTPAKKGATVTITVGKATTTTTTAPSATTTTSASGTPTTAKKSD